MFKFESIDELKSKASQMSIVLQAKIANRALTHEQRSTLLGEVTSALGVKAKDLGSAACEIAIAFQNALEKEMAG